MLHNDIVESEQVHMWHNSIVSRLIKAEGMDVNRRFKFINGSINYKSCTATTLLHEFIELCDRRILD